jgi:hypothetical protein
MSLESGSLSDSACRKRNSEQTTKYILTNTQVGLAGDDPGLDAVARCFVHDFNGFKLNRQQTLSKISFRFIIIPSLVLLLA